MMKSRNPRWELLAQGKSFKVVIEGKEYPSLNQAAKALGMPRTTLMGRFYRGEWPFSGKNPCRSKMVSIKINGVEYPSIMAAHKATGEKYSRLYAKHRIICK